MLIKRWKTRHLCSFLLLFVAMTRNDANKLFVLKFTLSKGNNVVSLSQLFCISWETTFHLLSYLEIFTEHFLMKAKPYKHEARMMIKNLSIFYVFLKTTTFCPKDSLASFFVHLWDSRCICIVGESRKERNLKEESETSKAYRL